MYETPSGESFCVQSFWHYMICQSHERCILILHQSTLYKHLCLVCKKKFTVYFKSDISCSSELCWALLWAPRPASLCSWWMVMEGEAMFFVLQEAGQGRILNLHDGGAFSRISKFLWWKTEDFWCISKPTGKFESEDRPDVMLKMKSKDILYISLDSCSYTHAERDWESEGT